jgi:DNA-binding beta-propeller fold protein YncE
MDGMDRRLRDLLDAAVGEPPHQVGLAALRRRVVRRRTVECVTGAAAVAAAAVLIPVGIGAARHAARPDGGQWPGRGPAIYAVYDLAKRNSSKSPGSTVTPISTARNQAGHPVKVGWGPMSIPGGQIAITPGGKTAYVVNSSGGTIIPVSTAHNRAGKPIYIGHCRPFGPDFIAITPNGQTAYVANLCANTVIPVSTATNTPGRPIHVGSSPAWIAITPNGRTAYVANESRPGTVTPIDTATNTAGPPIHVSEDPFDIAITPDGKTAYVLGRTASKHTRSVVTPINTVTNRPGKPVYLQGIGGAGYIAITPNGKTAYVSTDRPSTVVPISTATNTAGKPIEFNGPDNPGGGQIVITPDGRLGFVLAGTDTVHPFDARYNLPGPPIRLKAGCQTTLLASPELSMAVTPDGKTIYVACEGAVVPVSTAGNVPGKPIHIALGYPMGIAIKP